MSGSWKDDDCAAIKAHYAVYSVPQAAALWCGVTDDLIKQILTEVTQLSQTGFGRGVWIHPQIPCMEARSRAIADAIESGLLPHGRENANPVAKGDHVAYERRHILGRDLKRWMEKAFPNEKPAFLFDEIERNSHSAISAEAYRALIAERDALKSRNQKLVESSKLLLDQKNTIESERDSLKAKVDKLSPSYEKNDPALINSQYWSQLSKLASQAINEYPKWKEKHRKVQKTGNLQDWLTKTIKANNREAEIIKKVLSDFFQELI